MSTRTVRRWVIKRETKARLAGMEDALRAAEREPAKAVESIKALIIATTNLTGVKP